ncbi:MAG: hypothetical protein JSW43_08900 [Gemmatimonadota bacterium]|nr:MAG: hypothetical protein JSW43_08900 [Gemmatimonadota bacterium]
MRRSVTLILIVLSALAAAAWGQESTPQPVGHRGVSILYEATIGTRLNRQPDPGVEDTRWFASWDLGLMAQRGDWAWGATLLAHADEDGTRWGIRPRYRRWLGGKTTLDLGAGVLLGGGTNYGVQSYPGFTGLVALSHGRWLGVSLELHAIRTAQALSHYYDPVLGERYDAAASGVDWGVYLGFRLNGVGALVASAAELVLGMAAAAALSSSW